ncbi:MAG: hypothetical protein Q9183_002619 [Haloplaca sp. 2 TL-2023]
MEKSHDINETHEVRAQATGDDVPVLLSHGLGAPAGKRPRTIHKRPEEHLEQPSLKTKPGTRRIQSRSQKIHEPKRTSTQSATSFSPYRTIIPSPYIYMPYSNPAVGEAGLQWKDISDQTASLATACGKQSSIIEKIGNNLNWKGASTRGQQPMNEARQNVTQTSTSFIEGSSLQDSGLGISLDVPSPQVETGVPRDENVGSHTNVLPRDVNSVAPRKAAETPHEDFRILPGKPPVEVPADDVQACSARAICAVSNLLTDDRSPMLNRGSKRLPSDTQLAAHDIRIPSADTSGMTAIHRPASQASMENQMVQRRSFWDTSSQCLYYVPWDQAHWSHCAFGGGADVSCQPHPETMNYPWPETTTEGSLVVGRGVTYSKPADRKVRRRPRKPSVNRPKDQPLLDGPPEPKKRCITQQAKKQRPDETQGAHVRHHAESPPNKDLGGLDRDDGTNHGKRGA